MLKHRILAAAVFVPALLYVVYVGGATLGWTCAALSQLMVWEFLRLGVGGSGGRWLFRLACHGLTLAAAALVLGWLPADVAETFWPGAVVVVMLASLAQPLPIAGAMPRAAAGFFAVGYCGTLLPYLAVLRGMPEGFALALMAMLATFGADTAAYFVGRAVGRHKLYPVVSPGKTVEGAVGAVAGGVLSTLALRAVLGSALPVTLVVVLGVVAAMGGMVGDLSESLLKRSAGVKDSSRLIPGHGGVLDRFDAMMFVAPAFWVVVRFWG